MREDYKEVIEKVLSGEMSFSYSSIREFLKSPLHFLQYKTGEKKTTDAMRKGVLIHKLLLEGEEEFNKDYVLFEKPVPASTMANAKNKAAYQELQEKHPDKQIISSDELKAAKEVVEVATNNATASEMLDFRIFTERAVSFEYNAYEFVGYIDIGTKFEDRQCNVDLKITDPTPDKIRWKVRDMRYDIQAFLYNLAITNNEQDAIWMPYFLMALNETGVSVTKIGSDYITQGKISIDMALERVDELKFLTEIEGSGCWLAGMEFWAENKKYFVL